MAANRQPIVPLWSTHPAESAHGFCAGGAPPAQNQAFTLSLAGRLSGTDRGWVRGCPDLRGAAAWTVFFRTRGNTKKTGCQCTGKVCIIYGHWLINRVHFSCMDKKEQIDMGRTVYVLRGWRGWDAYKIGCTANLKRRYRPHERNRVVATISIPESMNIYTAENMVHNAFHGKRVIRYGELFMLDEDDIQIISKSRFFEGSFILGGVGAGTHV